MENEREGREISGQVRQREENRQQAKAAAPARYAAGRDQWQGSRYEDPNRNRTGSRYQDMVRMERTIQWQKVFLGVLGGLLLVAYIVVAVIFAGRFYPGTMIYGINCSAKTSDWVKEQVEAQIGTYTLTLQERNGRSEVLSADQIGLRYEDQGGIEARLQRQRSYFWPVTIFTSRSQETRIGTVYDRDRIGEVLSTLACMQPENEIPPENAYVGEGENGYEIIPEVMGNTLIAQRVEEHVLEALDQGSTELSLEESECYIMPSVFSDQEELLEDVQARNELLGAEITLDFSDRKEEVNAKQIMEFVRRNPDGTYRIDEDAVVSYTAGLAERYDTYGGTRIFETSIGTTETLYGGDYGWAIDQDATAQMLLDKIREKSVEVTEPVYAYRGMCRDTDDIGDTYVEVCISRQEMWCYQDGELITDTPVVTGNPNLGNATPAGGVWKIDDKLTNFVLVGEGYRAPVDYWMPFNGNVGIHDLKTRYLFGSTIYLSHGSHGCVNTPLDAVSRIFDAVSVGTPVIVYEGEGTTPYGSSAWS